MVEIPTLESRKPRRRNREKEMFKEIKMINT